MNTPPVGSCEFWEMKKTVLCNARNTNPINRHGRSGFGPFSGRSGVPCRAVPCALATPHTDHVYVCVCVVWCLFFAVYCVQLITSAKHTRWTKTTANEFRDFVFEIFPTAGTYFRNDASSSRKQLEISAKNHPHRTITQHPTRQPC